LSVTFTTIKLTLHRLCHPELPLQPPLQLRQLSLTAALDRRSCNLQALNFRKPSAPLYNPISLHSITGIFVFHWCLILEFRNLWRCRNILWRCRKNHSSLRVQAQHTIWTSLSNLTRTQIIHGQDLELNEKFYNFKKKKKTLNLNIFNSNCFFNEDYSMHATHYKLRHPNKIDISKSTNHLYHIKNCLKNGYI